MFSVASHLSRLAALSEVPDIVGHAQDFRGARIYSNLLRLRSVAWLMVAAMPAIALLDLRAVAGLATANVSQLSMTVVAVRGMLVLVPLLFLLACRVPRSAEGVGRRHEIYMYGFIAFALLGAAVVAGLGQQLRPSIGAYLLAVFIAAAFLHLTLAESLLVHLPAWAVLVALLLLYRQDTATVTPDLVNATFMAALALVVSRIQYIDRARDFLNGRLIDQQQAELVYANAQLGEANGVLRRLSFLDSLTNGPNRRYLGEYLEREWLRAARDQTPLAVVMVDIDHFKEFNDRYGHQAGDRCLESVSAALRGALHRPADFLARYGGEEFVGVLPETDQVGACHVAEEMRLAVQALGTGGTADGEERVTVSLGVAARRPSWMDRPADLIAAADRSLYAAKSSGRNRYAAGAPVQRVEM